MVLRLLFTSLFILHLGGAVMAQAPGKAPPVDTIGIVAGGAGGTGIRIASDLARLFEGSGLRIIPIVGTDSVQDIEDLLSLKPADVAIVQASVLARYLAAYPESHSQLQYAAKLYSEELHILSRMQFMCLADLNGRRIGVGPKDSGGAIAAEAVFEANNISAISLHYRHEEAIERLKKGELDALVYVGGKSARAFDGITHKDRVHFLDVEYLPALQSSYLPAIITSEDYPNLVAPAESVATIGVSSVMIIRATPPQSERFKVMARFVEGFLAGFDRLNMEGFSPKWGEVNLRAPVKGLARFESAQRWLIASGAAAQGPSPPPEPDRQMKTMLREFVESQTTASTDQEEFFNQFVRWYQQHGPRRSQAQ
jgi:TRAP transporter TAXI family solute receptor